ncbi:hypothetical protein QR680_004051 [Steinernema hermaphroditum]|uniref:Uncharacterized protein n=1 Tax=Steinernema hermaphroditum TaxID=289476 RepID=A0AA39HMH6_9BILA|nr:hypothetical protein QR680_004051 [Steinernema hermaphroditum]
MITPGTVFATTSTPGKDAQKHKRYRIGYETITASVRMNGQYRYGVPHPSIGQRPVVIEEDLATSEVTPYQIVDNVRGKGCGEDTTEARDFGEEAMIIRSKGTDRFRLLRRFPNYIRYSDITFLFPHHDTTHAKMLGSIPQCLLVNNQVLPITSKAVDTWVTNKKDYFRDIYLTDTSIIVFVGSQIADQAALRRYDMCGENNTMVRWVDFKFHYPDVNSNTRHPTLLFHDEGDDIIYMVCKESGTISRLYRRIHKYSLGIGTFYAGIQCYFSEFRRNFGYISMCGEGATLVIVFSKCHFQKLIRRTIWHPDIVEGLAIVRVTRRSLASYTQILALQGPHMPTVRVTIEMNPGKRQAILSGYCGDLNCNEIHTCRLWKPRSDKLLGGTFEVVRTKVSMEEILDDGFSEPMVLDLFSPDYIKKKPVPMESKKFLTYCARADAKERAENPPVVKKPAVVRKREVSPPTPSPSDGKRRPFEQHQVGPSTSGGSATFPHPNGPGIFNVPAPQAVAQHGDWRDARFFRDQRTPEISSTSKSARIENRILRQKDREKAEQSTWKKAYGAIQKDMPLDGNLQVFNFETTNDNEGPGPSDPSADEVPGPSAPREATPGPSNARDATAGPSVPRHANPGPSDPRDDEAPRPYVPRDATSGPSAHRDEAEPSPNDAPPPAASVVERLHDRWWNQLDDFVAADRSASKTIFTFHSRKKDDLSQQEEPQLFEEEEAPIGLFPVSDDEDDAGWDEPEDEEEVSSIPYLVAIEGVIEPGEYQEDEHVQLYELFEHYPTEPTDQPEPAGMGRDENRKVTTGETSGQHSSVSGGNAGQAGERDSGEATDSSPPSSDPQEGEEVKAPPTHENARSLSSQQIENGADGSDSHTMAQSEDPHEEEQNAKCDLEKDSPTTDDRVHISQQIDEEKPAEKNSAESPSPASDSGMPKEEVESASTQKNDDMDSMADIEKQSAVEAEQVDPEETGDGENVDNDLPKDCTPLNKDGHEAERGSECVPIDPSTVDSGTASIRAPIGQAGQVELSQKITAVEELVMKDSEELTVQDPEEETLQKGEGIDKDGDEKQSKKDTMENTSSDGHFVISPASKTPEAIVVPASLVVEAKSIPPAQENYRDMRGSCPAIVVQGPEDDAPAESLRRSESYPVLIDRSSPLTDNATPFNDRKQENQPFEILYSESTVFEQPQYVKEKNVTEQSNKVSATCVEGGKVPAANDSNPIVEESEERKTTSTEAVPNEGAESAESVVGVVNNDIKGSESSAEAPRNNTTDLEVTVHEVMKMSKSSSPSDDLQSGEDNQPSPKNLKRQMESGDVTSKHDREELSEEKRQRLDSPQSLLSFEGTTSPNDNPVAENDPSSSLSTVPMPGQEEVRVSGQIATEQDPLSSGPEPSTENTYPTESTVPEDFIALNQKPLRNASKTADEHLHQVSEEPPVPVVNALVDDQRAQITAAAGASPSARITPTEIGEHSRCDWYDWRFLQGPNDSRRPNCNAVDQCAGAATMPDGNSSDPPAPNGAIPELSGSDSASGEPDAPEIAKTQSSESIMETPQSSERQNDGPLAQSDPMLPRGGPELSELDNVKDDFDGGADSDATSSEKIVEISKVSQEPVSHNALEVGSPPSGESPNDGKAAALAENIGVIPESVPCSSTQETTGEGQCLRDEEVRFSHKDNAKDGTSLTQEDTRPKEDSDALGRDKTLPKKDDGPLTETDDPARVVDGLCAQEEDTIQESTTIAAASSHQEAILPITNLPSCSPRKPEEAAPPQETVQPLPQTMEPLDLSRPRSANSPPHPAPRKRKLSETDCLSYSRPLDLSKRKPVSEDEGKSYPKEATPPALIPGSILQQCVTEVHTGASEGGAVAASSASPSNVQSQTEAAEALLSMHASSIGPSTSYSMPPSLSALTMQFVQSIMTPAESLMLPTIPAETLRARLHEARRAAGLELLPMYTARPSPNVQNNVSNLSQVVESQTVFDEAEEPTFELKGTEPVPESSVEAVIDLHPVEPEEYFQVDSGRPSESSPQAQDCSPAPIFSDEIDHEIHLDPSQLICETGGFDKADDLTPQEEALQQKADDDGDGLPFPTEETVVPLTSQATFEADFAQPDSEVLLVLADDSSSCPAEEIADLVQPDSEKVPIPGEPLANESYEEDGYPNDSQVVYCELISERREEASSGKDSPDPSGDPLVAQDSSAILQTSSSSESRSEKGPPKIGGSSRSTSDDEDDDEGPSAKSLGETISLISGALDVLYPSPSSKKSSPAKKTVKFPSGPSSPKKEDATTPSCSVVQSSLMRSVSAPEPPTWNVTSEVNAIRNYTETTFKDESYVDVTGHSQDAYDVQPGPSNYMQSANETNGYVPYQEPYQEPDGYVDYSQNGYTNGTPYVQQQQQYAASTMAEYVDSNARYDDPGYPPDAYVQPYVTNGNYMDYPVDSNTYNGYNAAESSATDEQTSGPSTSTVPNNEPEIAGPGSSSDSIISTSPAATPRRSKKGASPARGRKTTRKVDKPPRGLNVSYAQRLRELDEQAKLSASAPRVVVDPPPTVPTIRMSIVKNEPESVPAPIIVKQEPVAITVTPPSTSAQSFNPRSTTAPPMMGPTSSAALLNYVNVEVPNAESQDARILNILETVSGRPVKYTPKQEPTKEQASRKKKLMCEEALRVIQASVEAECALSDDETASRKRRNSKRSTSTLASANLVGLEDWGFKEEGDPKRVVHDAPEPQPQTSFSSTVSEGTSSLEGNVDQIPPVPVSVDMDVVMNRPPVTEAATYGDTVAAASFTLPPLTRRGRGRPKGSKSKTDKRRRVNTQIDVTVDQGLANDHESASATFGESSASVSASLPNLRRSSRRSKPVSRFDAAAESVVSPTRQVRKSARLHGADNTVFDMIIKTEPIDHEEEQHPSFQTQHSSVLEPSENSEPVGPDPLVNGVMHAEPMVDVVQENGYFVEEVYQQEDTEVIVDVTVEDDRFESNINVEVVQDPRDPDIFAHPETWLDQEETSFCLPPASAEDTLKAPEDQLEVKHEPIAVIKEETPSEVPTMEVQNSEPSSLISPSLDTSKANGTDHIVEEVTIIQNGGLVQNHIPEPISVLVEPAHPPSSTASPLEPNPPLTNEMDATPLKSILTKKALSSNVTDIKAFQSPFRGKIERPTSSAETQPEIKKARIAEPQGEPSTSTSRPNNVATSHVQVPMLDELQSLLEKKEYLIAQRESLMPELEALRAEVEAKESLLDRHQRAEKFRDDDIAEVRAKLARAANSDGSSPSSSNSVGSSCTSPMIDMSRAPVVHGKVPPRKRPPLTRPSDSPRPKRPSLSNNAKPSTSDTCRCCEAKRLLASQVDLPTAADGRIDTNALVTLEEQSAAIGRQFEELTESARNYRATVAEIEALRTRRDFLAEEIAKLAKSIEEKRAILRQLSLSSQYMSLVNKKPSSSSNVEEPKAPGDPKEPKEEKGQKED